MDLYLHYFNASDLISPTLLQVRKIISIAYIIGVIIYKYSNIVNQSTKILNTVAYLRRVRILSSVATQYAAVGQGSV